jgi:hypothetical protein
MEVISSLMDFAWLSVYSIWRIVSLFLDHESVTFYGVIFEIVMVCAMRIFLLYIVALISILLLHHRIMV